jgi:hypothetical protein
LVVFPIEPILQILGVLQEARGWALLRAQSAPGFEIGGYRWRPPRDDWLCLLSQFRNGYGLMLTGQIAVRFTLCS